MSYFCTKNRLTCVFANHYGNCTRTTEEVDKIVKKFNGVPEVYLSTYSDLVKATERTEEVADNLTKDAKQ